MSTLLIDIGNTRIKWYFDSEAQPLTKNTIPPALNHHDEHWLDDLQKAWTKEPVATTCYISNVAHQDILQKTRDVLFHTFPDCSVHVLTAQKQHRTFVLAYDTPTQMGSDRYAQLLGAQSLIHKKNHIVISAGTATTIDGVLAGGQHIGGLILPSEDLMRKSLHEYTAKLPLDGGEIVFENAPNKTTDSLATAAHLASIGAVREFASRYMPSNDFELVLCGGRANSLIKPFSETHNVHLVPSLCLLGLKHAQLET